MLDAVLHVISFCDMFVFNVKCLLCCLKYLFHICVYLQQKKYTLVLVAMFAMGLVIVTLVVGTAIVAHSAMAANVPEQLVVPEVIADCIPNYADVSN